MRRFGLRVLASSLLLFVLIASRAAADSRLIFPTLEEGTRLSVLNVSDTPNEVVLRAISVTGELISGPGVTNPITLSIEPHGQIARLARDLFGLSSSHESSGWVEVTSSGAGELKGSFQIESPELLSRVFEAASDPQRSLVLLPPPAVSLSGGVLHIVNGGQEFASVAIRFLSAAGETVEEISQIIPPAGKWQPRLDDIAPGLVAGAAVSLQIDSTEEVAAFMRIGSGNRVIGVPGVSTETTSGLRGFFSLGPSMGVALRIASASPQPMQLRLIFRAEDGRILSTPHPADFSLPSGGVFEARLDSRILDESGPVRGWIEVVGARTGDLLTVAGSLTFGSVRDGVLVPESLVRLQAGPSTSHILMLPEATGNEPFRRPVERPASRDTDHPETADGRFALLALHNPGESEAEVSIIQRSQAGETLSSARLTLGPEKYVLRQLEAPDPRGGTVEIRASAEILGAYLGSQGNGPPRLLPFQPVFSGETNSGSKLAVDFRIGDGSRHTGEKAVNLDANFTLVRVSGALKTPPCAVGGTYVVTAVFRNSSGTHYYGNISAAVATLTGGNTLTSQSFTLPAIGIVGPNEQITGVFNIRLATCNRFQFFINLMGDECVIPVNFRQMGAGTDTGGGTLHFDYRWDSSTGRLADLAACMVGERVDYRAADLPFPSPPFPAGLNPNNPTILNVAATEGRAQDNHSTPGDFVKPFAAASVTAMQIYRYTCPCSNGGNPVTIFGPLAIVRSVIRNPNGSFRFEITKSGATATINPLP
jgi:hypothetical protein